MRADSGVLSGGGSQGPASGGASSVPPPGDDRTLDELTQEEAAALCLSDVTEEMLYQRCDARAMLTAREGAEVDYAAECERLRGACIASRDNGTIDLECQAFGLLTTMRCAATVGEYKSCVAAVPVPETVPGCSMAYSEAQAYTVSPPPDITGIPACDALRACYQMYRASQGGAALWARARFSLLLFSSRAVVVQSEEPELDCSATYSLPSEGSCQR